VKVKSFRGPRLVVASLAQGRTILRGFWFLVCARKFLWLGLLLATVAVGFLMMPFDPGLLVQLHFWSDAQDETARNIARFLSTWGDYPQYNVTLAVAIWLYGAWKKSSAWRRIAMICFLGSSLAGLFDDCFRMTVGRPRPETHLADGFYGITNALQGTYQSFPSGHAATTFGTAAALIVFDLPLGLLTTLYALAVVWARMELYRHYPSDVFVGASIGLYFGLMVAFGAKCAWSTAPKGRPERAHGSAMGI
jgi:membrane-associated phospholipid phosphatase